MRSYLRRPGDRRPQDVRNFRVYAPWWIDPNWYLTGSSIEKKVMAELQRRGVYFIYRNQSNSLGGFVDPTWEADFLLPHHKIWIEVQGSYFHSLPGQIEKDSLRFAAIEMAGWKPIALWEFDIETRLHDLLDEIGVFYQVDLKKEADARKKYGVTDETFKVGKRDDQLKGLRASLAKRRKPDQLIYRRRRAGERRPK
jgi:very-short-patch-repair endonuclease